MSTTRDNLVAIDNAAGDMTKVPLTRGEEIRLARLEAVVDEAIKSWALAAQAIKAIRDGKLYRCTHSTFEAYVNDRFGYARQHAYRMIEAVAVVEAVSPMGDIANERQARELAGLRPEQARETYQRALAETAGRPTARAVREARQDRVRPLVKARRNPLPDRYRGLVSELDRVTRQLDQLHRDDRFAANRVELARLHAALTTEIAGRVAAFANDLGGPIEDELPLNVSTSSATTVCTVCSTPLDRVLVSEGERTHPGCESS